LRHQRVRAVGNDEIKAFEGQLDHGGIVNVFHLLAPVKAGMAASFRAPGSGCAAAKPSGEVQQLAVEIAVVRRIIIGRHHASGEDFRPSRSEVQYIVPRFGFGLKAQVVSNPLVVALGHDLWRVGSHRGRCIWHLLAPLLKSPGWRFVPRTGMRGVETSDVTFLAPGFVLAELLTSMVADSGFFRDLGPQPDAD
jgi:hypothetical protein